MVRPYLFVRLPLSANGDPIAQTIVLPPCLWRTLKRRSIQSRGAASHGWGRFVRKCTTGIVHPTPAAAKAWHHHWALQERPAKKKKGEKPKKL